jgi:hypothetical protein
MREFSPTVEIVLTNTEEAEARLVKRMCVMPTNIPRSGHDESPWCLAAVEMQEVGTFGCYGLWCRFHGLVQFCDTEPFR